MLIRLSPTGKTAPRLINDLLDHDPRHAMKHGRNLLADPAPTFKWGGSHLPPRKGSEECRHVLALKQGQTNAPTSNDERPDEYTKYKIAAYCSSCMYHFDIGVDFTQRKERQEPCNLSDEENPLHHLRLVKSTNAREYRQRQGRRLKYDNCTELHRFMCSGSKCPLVVEIKISPPRLAPNILVSITEPAVVEARGRREIKNEPERYQDMSHVTVGQSLGFLRQYLNDAKGGSGRKIARRNKKYMLAFADECDPLFEYLDFKAIEEPSSESDVSDFY